MLSHFYCVQLFAVPWTAAFQAPLSMGFFKQEYWSELPCPPPGDLPNPGIEPKSPTVQVDSLLSEPQGKPPKKQNTEEKSLNELANYFSLLWSYKPFYLSIFTVAVAQLLSTSDSL